MWMNVLQNLGVLLLAILFSILFASINNRRARNEKSSIK